MTTNDQAAMNEQLTQLRLQGLSIDGDNRYKQDLIDAVIGAMMFGAQGANPPPSGHWLEQFYVIAREERQALARVEAAYANRLRNVKQLESERDTAQAQLAEAVGLLRYSQEIARLFDDEHTAEVGRFLARHTQSEQQEAPPGWAPCSPDLLKSGVCCESAPRIAGRPGSGVSHYHPAPKQEAQGAQAGGERAGFKKEYDAFRQWAGSRLTARQLDLDEVGLFYDEIAGFAHDAWQARAALATQPAAGEPVASGVNYADEVDLIRAVLEGYSPSIARSDAICSVKLLAAYFAAPPAAAHGDEAVPTDLRARCEEISQWRKTGVLRGDALREYAESRWPGDHSALQMAEHETASEAFQIVAAMRAQGDGESV